MNPRRCGFGYVIWLCALTHKSLLYLKKLSWQRIYGLYYNRLELVDDDEANLGGPAA